MKIGSRVRSANDGQLGVVVELEGGGLGVRLDRKAENRVYPLRLKDGVSVDWLPDTETRLTAAQIARITYEADKALRMVTGEYGLPDWISLPEPTRLKWIRGGLPENASLLREQLHRAILKVLAG